MAESDQSDTSTTDGKSNGRKRSVTTLDRRRSKRILPLTQEIEEQKNVIPIVNRPGSGSANNGVDEFEEKVEVIPTRCAQSKIATERTKDGTIGSMGKECNKSYNDTSITTAQEVMEEGHLMNSDFRDDCYGTPSTNDETTIGKCLTRGQLNKANDIIPPNSSRNIWPGDKAGKFVHYSRDSNDAVANKMMNESWPKKSNDTINTTTLMTGERTVECLKQEREIRETANGREKKTRPLSKYSRSLSKEGSEKSSLHPKYKQPSNSQYRSLWKSFCGWVVENESTGKGIMSLESYLTRTNVDGFFRCMEQENRSKSYLSKLRCSLQWYASNAFPDPSGDAFVVNSPIVQEIVSGEKSIMSKKKSTTEKCPEPYTGAQAVCRTTGSKESKSREERKQRSDQKYQREEKDRGPLAEESEGEAPVPLKPVKFDLVKDPNKYYTEEEAHLYHNPPIPSKLTEGITPGELGGIPPPHPLPELPSTGKCHWKFDEMQRVLLADFTPSQVNDEGSIDRRDKRFFLEMLERNDITVVSEGLICAKAMNPKVWKLQHLQSVLGQEYYHKFRRFDTIKDEHGFESCREIDGLYSMKIGDYIAYLSQRCKNLADDDEDRKFTFTDCEGKEKVIDDVRVSAIYMLDLDMNKSLPDMYSNFMECFRFPAVLPGGSYCMMNSVTPNARPFMGPKMYMTPPAAFTHFHQDGHGTVDSGHLCLKGYNEVVLLRRLTERHKKHALMILTGNLLHNADINPEYFDALYQVPHGDELGDKPEWPTKEQIEKCRQMGYCPTVVTIKPGQLLHINKGRLHAFRKMSPSPLPAHDCHKELREQLIKERSITGEELCISVAWNWMFKGITSPGINREVLSVLEAAILNRKRGKFSLSIPEMSLLQMAKFTPPIKAVDSSHQMGVSGMVGFIKNDQNIVTRKDTSNTDAMCLGILPGLRHVVKEHVSAMEQKACQSDQRGKRVTIANRPNTHENPSTFPVDPYGNNDFFCKLCNQELSNVYFHCDGCEQLLSKDFNICRKCHAEKMFCQTIQMHPSNPKRHSTLNHTGLMPHDRASRCPCRNGPACKNCGYCSGCSCRCHTWFTLHYRLFNKDEENALLAKVEASTEAKAVNPIEPFHKYLDPAFTEARLANASRKHD